MDPYDKVFAESYIRILGQGAYNPKFVERFYDLFLASSSEIAERFANTDMSRQKTMLHDSFTSLLDFARHKQASPQMEVLARVHGPKAHNIPPKLYELWLDSLLQTVAELDPGFNREVELAWRLTLAPGITYLQYAYTHPVE